MKKIIQLLIFIWAICLAPCVQSSCFLIKDDTDFLVREGDYNTRHAPCCTFNLVLALAGFNEKVLVDRERPEWPYEENYKASREILKQPHNPTTWMQNSSVWYSQILVKDLTY